MIYLCSPHNHPDQAVRLARERGVREVSAALIVAGLPVFSPIVYGVALAPLVGGGALANWIAHNNAMVEASSALWVADIYGWRDSVGTANDVMHYHRTREAFTAEPGRVLNTSAFMSDAKHGLTYNDVRDYTRPLSAAELERMEGLIVREGLAA